MLDPPGYHLDRLVGRGATAEVWLAWPDEETPGVSGPVAVKRLLKPVAEVCLERQVAHPNLLPLLAVIADGPGTALVTPYLPGGSLRDLLDDRGTLTAGEVVAILRPVAEALEALHQAELIHGDVKPENVLLEDSGVPVLADVEAARPMGVVGCQIMGSAAYLAPESVVGREVDGQADVFGLGVIAYEALTGRLPHRGEPAEVLAAAAGAVHRPLASWPTVRPGVAALVEQAIGPDPNMRPVGPLALAAALAREVPPATIRLPGTAAGRRQSEPRRDRSTHTLQFGPRPPQPSATDDRDRAPWWAVAVQLVPIVVVLAVLLALWG